MYLSNRKGKTSLPYFRLHFEETGEGKKLLIDQSKSRESGGGPGYKRIKRKALRCGWQLPPAAAAVFLSLSRSSSSESSREVATLEWWRDSCHRTHELCFISSCVLMRGETRRAGKIKGREQRSRRI